MIYIIRLQYKMAQTFTATNSTDGLYDFLSMLLK